MESAQLKINGYNKWVNLKMILFERNEDKIKENQF